MEQLRRMPRLDQPEERTKYVADTILSQMGDAHSTRFYRLVAAKIPEAVIRRMLSEIKIDGAENPAKVFTYKVNEYAKSH